VIRWDHWNRGWLMSSRPVIPGHRCRDEPGIQGFPDVQLQI
jgi:hypothetical protein